MLKRLIIMLVLITSSDLLADECEILLKSKIQNELAFTYEEFDQTENNGFRPLEKMFCFKEAAELLELYIIANQSNKSSLRWHLAQMKAFNGEYEAAIVYANSVIDIEEDLDDFPLMWNDFVNANIAFLMRDKEALIKYRDKISARKNFKPNELNLLYVEKLLVGFDSTYQKAIYD
ncbi:hypothetical protein BCU94_18655 [Shewanella sp. 10N.286.52.C2]|nr:hypothetical protein BCU94_18655 [Shewanella sp. 10N.286.52.C2]